MDAAVVGWTDGRTDGRMDGRMDGWMVTNSRCKFGLIAIDDVRDSGQTDATLGPSERTSVRPNHIKENRSARRGKRKEESVVNVVVGAELDHTTSQSENKKRGNLL